MSSLPARGYFSISEVLAQLRADFPDISVSKIRFLETEGLIAPARSPAGYRRFCAADVDRLRHILTAQRDQYLPLRVIKERLAGLDGQLASPARPPTLSGLSGLAGPVGLPGQRSHGGTDPSISALTGQDATAQLLTKRELIDATGLTEALLTELETFGLLRKVGRQYGSDAVDVARAAIALAAYGVEARHLRAVRAAAERETAMIESVVAPIQRQRNPGARDLAGRTAGDIAGLVLGLHQALVAGALAEAGLAADSRLIDSSSGPGMADRGAGAESSRQDPARRAARGIGGASA
jgi:DNA-binding transcriptional MerR regulator